MLDLYLVLAQLYATTILIRQSQAYVLLAANIDDFKSIARKFVPEHLVDQLADLAAKPPVGNDENEYSKSIQFKNKPTSDTNEEESKELRARRGKDALRLTKVNFEQLVEKVKERLKRDFKDSREDTPRFKKRYTNKSEYAPKRLSEKIYPDDIEKGFNKNKYADYDVERSPAQSKYADDEVDEIRQPKSKYADDDVERSPTKNIYANDEVDRSSAKNKYADDEVERRPAKNKYADDDAEKSPTKIKYADDEVERSPPKDKYDEDYEAEKTSSKNKYLDDSIPKKYADEYIEETSANPPVRLTVRPPRIPAKKPQEVRKPERPAIKKPQKTKDNSEEYKDYAEKDYKMNQDVPQKPKKAKKEVLDDSMLFSKVEMVKGDSYEDYVTPPKEEDIFESAEQSSRAPLKKPKEIIKMMKQEAEKRNKKTNAVVQLKKQTEDIPKSPLDGTVQKMTAKDEDDKEIVDVVIGDEETPDDKEYKEYANGEDLKAKTENINYDEFATTKTEAETEGTTPIGSVKTTKKKKQGTMFPKRDYYKISSPNYLAKVPVIAEGYNFDEPIPEKDQEPEDLKRLLPLPPSVVNGKVQISK